MVPLLCSADDSVHRLCGDLACARNWLTGGARFLVLPVSSSLTVDDTCEVVKKDIKSRRYHLYIVTALLAHSRPRSLDVFNRLSRDLVSCHLQRYVALQLRMQTS